MCHKGPKWKREAGGESLRKRSDDRTQRAESLSGRLLRWQMGIEARNAGRKQILPQSP
jgi:hypothetical protein